MRVPSVIFVNVDAAGHVSPTLAVATELRRRGASVLYFAPEQFRGPVTASGATFFGYASTNPFDTASKNDFAGWMAHMMSEAKHVLPQVAERAKAANADVVVYDRHAITGRVLTDYLRVPGVMTFSSYGENERFTLSKMFELPKDDHPALAQAEIDAADIARTFQVPQPSVKELFGARVEGKNIVFLPRSFQFESEVFDDRFAFVGPSIASASSDSDWTPPPGDRPLLFVSLGTSARKPWPEFFTMCIDALRDAKWNVIMATGRRAEASQLGELPANFTVVQHAPQIDVLRHADMFIAHGGMNSTMEALYFGVPMVVIPQMPEQDATAVRVAQLGLGRALDRATMTSASLREAVLAVAEDPEVRRRLLEMKRNVREAGGHERAATVILDYIAARK